MKVNIYETVEVSDEQRALIARSIDGDGAKKRPATRDEIKEFIWANGSGWDVALANVGEPTEKPDDEADDDEDLLG